MKKIVVTGGSGLVGGYLRKYFPSAIFLSSKDYDLTNESDVDNMYLTYKPEIVIHLAAKVGGIIDNINKPAEYFTENVLMNTLLIKYAHKYNVNRFIGVLSTCIYPDILDNYPMSEDDIHKGPPTKTNFSYGYAKRLMAVQIESYNQQYGTNYQYLIPCNLYGLTKKNDENNSHYINSLIKKIYDANFNNLKNITLFGDGTPKRQFMFADDFAKIIHLVVEKNIFENLNVATDENLSIKDMCDIALQSCNSEHLEVFWDKKKPNGQYRKDVSTNKLKSLLPEFKPLTLSEGIKITYKNYYDKFSK
jgi:GDP-L-fucose synthase